MLEAAWKRAAGSKRMYEDLRKFLLAFGIISTCFFLVSCEQPSPEGSQPGIKEESPDSVLFHPLTPEKGEEIEAVYGWLDQDTVLFSSRQKGQDETDLQKWNWKTNEKKVLYQSNEPFTEVSVNPDQSYILSTSSESTGHTTIKAFDRMGKSLCSVTLPAYELTYEWNAYKDDSLFLSVFSKDWSYNSYVLNIEEDRLQAIEYPQPFAQWDDKENMLYLDWRQDEPALTAPLIKKEVDGGRTETLMLDVVHFRKLKDVLMTIQVETENRRRATYKFTDESTHKTASMSLPHLDGFSEWIIPYYDFNEQIKEFLTFVPEKTDNIDVYDGKFNLLKFNWQTGKRTELLKGMENEPISCSSDERFCLYGKKYEKLIDLKTGGVRQLIKK